MGYLGHDRLCGSLHSPILGVAVLEVGTPGLPFFCPSEEENGWMHRMDPCHPGTIRLLFCKRTARQLPGPVGGEFCL